MRIAYRVRQLRAAISASPSAADIAALEQELPSPLMELFSRMQPSEQAHSLHIYHQLRCQGVQDPDLLVAALLHDVGKSCSPLSIWERSLIVIAKALLPHRFARWGAGKPEGWRRPFVVAEQHPAWGAEMAAAAGAPPLAVSLIRRHAEKIPSSKLPLNCEDQLLELLQRVDNES